MAQPARRADHTEAPPEYDPRSIGRRLAFERARREERRRRKLGRRWAGFRFFLVILVLLAFTVAIAVFIWQEIQRLFGI